MPYSENELIGFRKARAWAVAICLSQAQLAVSAPYKAACEDLAIRLGEMELPGLDKAEMGG